MSEKSVSELICPHVGKNHPRSFSCIDCTDTAADCNCLDCMGVFCAECNEMVWVLGDDGEIHSASCPDICDAWYNKDLKKVTKNG